MTSDGAMMRWRKLCVVHKKGAQCANGAKWNTPNLQLAGCQPNVLDENGGCGAVFALRDAALFVDVLQAETFLFLFLFLRARKECWQLTKGVTVSQKE
jgi:hypothetical protein